MLSGNIQDNIESGELRRALQYNRLDIDWGNVFQSTYIHGGVLSLLLEAFFSNLKSLNKKQMKKTHQKQKQSKKTPNNTPPKEKENKLHTYFGPHLASVLYTYLCVGLAPPSRSRALLQTWSIPLWTLSVQFPEPTQYLQNPPRQSKGTKFPFKSPSFSFLEGFFSQGNYYLS